VGLGGGLLSKSQIEKLGYRLIAGDDVAPEDYRAAAD
jgi:hypothetical protein